MNSRPDSQDSPLAHRQSALLRLATGIAAAHDEDAVCASVVDGLHDDALGYNFIGVFLVDPGSGQRVMRASVGWPGSHEDYRVLLLRGHATLPRVEAKEEEKPAEEEKSPQRVAREELLAELKSGTEITKVFVATVILSAVVAAVGLLRDNVAVIIGAMVIAPLLGPNMAMALAVTLGDLDLLKRSLRTQAVGVGIALAFAVLLGLLFPEFEKNREIGSRTGADVPDVAIALASGAAALMPALPIRRGLVGKSRRSQNCYAKHKCLRQSGRPCHRL